MVATLTACYGGPDRAPHSRPRPPASTAAEATEPATEDDRAQASAARPHSARQALSTLVSSEQVIADPDAHTHELVRAARQQQLAYREAAAHPGWDEAVLAGVPRSLRSVVRDNLASRREFRAMHTDLSDTLPAWRIVPPAPAEDLLRYY